MTDSPIDLRTTDEPTHTTPSARLKALKRTRVPPAGCSWVYPPHQGTRQRDRNKRRLLKSGGHWQCGVCGDVFPWDGAMQPQLHRQGVRCCVPCLSR